MKNHANVIYFCNVVFNQFKLSEKLMLENEYLIIKESHRIFKKYAGIKTLNNTRKLINTKTIYLKYIVSY